MGRRWLGAGLSFFILPLESEAGCTCPWELWVPQASWTLWFLLPETLPTSLCSTSPTLPTPLCTSLILTGFGSVFLFPAGNRELHEGRGGFVLLPVCPLGPLCMTYG